MDQFAFVLAGGSGDSGGGDVRALERAFPGISFPLLPPALLRLSNLLSPNGAAPLTCRGHIGLAVKFLYYCLLIFISANHGSDRKFHQSAKEL